MAKSKSQVVFESAVEAAVLKAMAKKDFLKRVDRAVIQEVEGMFEDLNVGVSNFLTEYIDKKVKNTLKEYDKEYAELINTVVRASLKDRLKDAYLEF